MNCSVVNRLQKWCMWRKHHGTEWITGQIFCHSHNVEKVQSQVSKLWISWMLLVCVHSSTQPKTQGICQMRSVSKVDMSWFKHSLLHKYITLSLYVSGSSISEKWENKYSKSGQTEHLTQLLAHHLQVTNNSYYYVALLPFKSLAWCYW